MPRLLVLMVSLGCGCHLVFPHAPVPGPASAGPFAFSLLADCVGDSCTHSTCKELAWCTP